MGNSTKKLTRFAYQLLLMLFLIPLFLTPILLAQELDPTPVPQTKGGDSLLGFNLGDSQVDFYLLGTWQFTLFGTYGFTIRPDVGLTALDYFPDFEQGFFFNQIPDLTASAWLDQRFFIEFSVLGTFENNYFLMGYQGLADEFIHHIYLGNRYINIDAYPFLIIPDQGNSSIGVEAEFFSDPSRHQLLLRYDNNENGEKLFIGSNEVVESTQEFTSYRQGWYFKLPDANINDLQVYVENPLGTYHDADNSTYRNDGRRYRLVTADEAVLDATNGLLTFKLQPTGRVLVYYTKGGNAVGDTALGRNAVASIDAGGNMDPGTPADFDWTQTVAYEGSDFAALRRVDLGSKTCLLIWEPGEFSPFEILASYALPEGAPSESWRIKVFIAAKGQKTVLPAAVYFRVLPAECRFSAYQDDNLRQNIYNLYPLYNQVSDGDAVYSPFREVITGQYNKEIVLQILYPISSYVLEPGILPGSVQVLRNGAEESRYTVNYQTGELQFTTTINETDRIEIHYKREISLLNNGDLLFAWGNVFPVNPFLTIKFAAGFRWDALPGSFSEEPLTRTGGVVSSFAITGDYPQVYFNVEAALSLSHPDTTGILRLFGMENSGLSPALSDDMAFPAAVPDGIYVDAGITAASQMNRGILYYKDYRSYDFLGSYTLKELSWNSAQNWPYENYSKIGPYNTLDHNSPHTKSLVFDFLLDGNEWVGAQIPLFYGYTVSDLSRLKGISISYKSVNFSQNYRVYVQLGELDEDLDGDGRLDTESSASSAGYSFNDQAHGLTLLVGGGPRQQGDLKKDSEDADGNGFIDPANTSNTLTLPTPIDITGDTGWSVYSYAFTEADRQKLTRVRALRIIIVEQNGNTCSGKFLIDKIELNGTTFGITQTSTFGGNVTVREISENLISLTPPSELEDAFPEVKNTFHSTGATQKVLEINWTGFDESEAWTVQGFSRYGTSTARYNEVDLYFRLPSLVSDSPDTDEETLSFALLDNEGRGMRWSFALADTTYNSWQHLRVDLQRRKLYIGDQLVAGASVSVSSHYDSLNRFTVSLSGSQDGLLYLDELNLREPQMDFGGALNAEARFSFPGELLAIGSTAVFSDLNLYLRLSTVSPHFSGLYDTPSASWTNDLRIETDCGFFVSSVALFFAVTGQDEDFDFNGGHLITLPRADFPLVITDKHELYVKGTQTDFYRENTLNVDIFNWAKADFTTESFAVNQVLVQNWRWDLFFLGPANTVLLSLDFSLSRSVENFSYPYGDYFSSWILGYTFTGPYHRGEEDSRTASSYLTFRSYTKPLDVNILLNMQAQSAQITTDSRDLTGSLSYTLAFPILLSSTQNIVLTPTYKRTWSSTSSVHGPGDCGEDLYLWGYFLSRQSYPYAAWPIGEIFDGQSIAIFKGETSFVDQASYTPQLSFNFTSRIGSHWSGLFLPSGLGVVMQRDFLKDGDLYAVKNTYSLVYNTNVINLFGKYGAYPLFDFYTIDEFANSLQLNLTYSEHGVLDNSILQISNLLSFETESGNLFILENNFYRAQGDINQTTDVLSFSYNWFIRPENGVPFFFLPEKVVKTGFLSNTEVLAFSFESLPDETSVHPLQITLSHDTTFDYPDYGYVKFLCAFGFDIETLEQGSYDLIYRFVFKLGIEGLFRF